ncbi:hypothetical protein GALMADRAFT_211670 [Galerina marginata CBS 339.88]|uniref:Uncharacterized protein n=1 Tax=Galerina marginata (strain CBS 339.88) TaxID=685588 RepID=A0A067T413_GALM3|nr:hypothetical protein GALMADRAFT_211670 [Galerina marginata CBS 339.88]
MAPGGWRYTLSVVAIEIRYLLTCYHQPQETSVPQSQQPQRPASSQHEFERRPNSNGTSNPSGDPYDADLEGDCWDDPRIRAHATPKRTTKSQQEKLVHDAPDNPSEGAPPSLPTLPPSPDSRAVKDYLSFHNTGPSGQSPLLLWEEPMTHPWNARLVQLLSSEFIEYAKEKQLLKLVQLLGDDIRTPDLIDNRLEGIADISKLIHDKLSSHCSECLVVLRKIEKMKARSMTTTEILATLNTATRGRKDHLRRSERKKLLYCRRHEIIEESLLKPTIIGDPSAADLWKQIQQFFSSFTHEDMSSDETETEKTYLTPKTIRRIRRYWIHDDVTQVWTIPHVLQCFC